MHINLQKLNLSSFGNRLKIKAEEGVIYNYNKITNANWEQKHKTNSYLVSGKIMACRVANCPVGIHDDRHSHYYCTTVAGSEW